MEQHNTDILVIGAGLTGLTTAFRLTRGGKQVHVLECSNRVGGQIHTFREDGFVFESGPNTGVVSYPEVAELFEALSPACQLETAHEEAKRRLIWKGNSFRALPSGLLSAVTTPLFTLGDKFRILGEPFRAKGTNPDESVGELAARITRYALPKLYNLEQQYGGFIKGTIAKARQPKTARDRLATKKVFSAAGGLENLAKAMANAIGFRNITLSASGVTVRPSEKGWLATYTTSEGEQLMHANKVVTTSGAYTLPDLLPFIPREDMDKISNLQYAPVVQVSVGIRNTGSLRFNAFGGLVPSCEKKDVLGILFPAACFDNRAPKEGALFSFFIGGVKRTELTRLSDDELKGLITHEFHAMLKFPIQVQPDMIRIFRHQHAIPQYGLSSGERFATIDQLEARYPGLILAGNMKGGIGMADRIRQATGIAENLLM